MNFEKIPKLVLKRHVTVLMSFIAIIVIGIVVLLKIEQEFMPKGLTSPYMGARIFYPNSTPEEIEQMIVKKVEGELNTIPQMKRTRVRIMQNGAWFFIEFDADANIDQAYFDFLDRLERVKPELPEESQNYRIRRFGENSNDMSIFILQEKDDPYVYQFVESFIKKRIERVDGVANVDFDSSMEKNLYIYFKSDLIKAYRINIYDVIQKIRTENFNMSSGYSYNGENKIFVRSIAKINSVEKLQNLVINKNGLKLKEIADVGYSDGDRRWAWRINGKKGMDLEITKESQANTVKVTDEIVEVINELNNNRQVKEMGLQIQVIFNKGDYIKQSVYNLLESGIWGGFFAFGLIFFFLRRTRITMIITFAIPLSILITIVAIYFMGWSLNGMTMMGLLIAIGLVVDNGIVIIENIFHKRREGLSLKDSAIVGTSEVGLAITMATLTTVAIFIPILFLPQNGLGGYLKTIGVPVIFALLASLFVAIIYIPFASTRISSTRPVKDSKLISKISNKLSQMTMFFIHRRVEGFIVFLILLFLLVEGPQPQFVGMSGGNINDFRVMIELPNTFNFEKSDAFLKELEKKLTKQKDKYKIKAYSANARTQFARLSVFLEDKEIPSWYYSVYKKIRRGLAVLGVPPLKERMTRKECEEDFRKMIPKIPGLKIRSRWMEDEQMRSDISVNLAIEGDDTKLLLKIAHEMERRLNTLDQVVQTDINLEQGQDEIIIGFDRKKLEKYGLSAKKLRQMIDYNIRGFRLRKFQTEDGNETSLIAQSQRKDRSRLEQLKNLMIFTREGKSVPLSTVANFQIKKGLGTIKHENGKTVLKVKALLENGEDIQIVQSQLSSLMAGLDMPFGYKWGLGRISRQVEEDQGNFMFALSLGVVLVFLLMGVLFESFILPISVIVSIPLALIGAKYFAIFTGTEVGLMAMIGSLILVGIVVNNGIVLIDQIIRYRKRGFSRNEAIEKASLDRARPIMLTALTTMMGLLPMVVGESEFVGIKYAPLGRIVFGGLLASTILTIVYTPLFYTFFDDLRQKFMKLIQYAFTN
jgi:HAE1 family hydrophobic/amphiphilic exporter-1